MRWFLFLLPLLLGACGSLNQLGGIRSDFVLTEPECQDEARRRGYTAGISCQAGVNDQQHWNLERLRARDKQVEEQARSTARSGVKYDPNTDSIAIPYDCETQYSFSLPARIGCKWGIEEGREGAWRARQEFRQRQLENSYSRGKSAVPPILPRY